MRKILALIFILGLSGCTTLASMSANFNGLFKDADNAELSTELTQYEPEIKLQMIWHETDGSGVDGLALNLVPAVTKDRIIIADHDGMIQARNLLDGELLWEVETDLPISSGPVIDSDLLFVATSKADVLALNTYTGKAVWKHRVSSEVIALPVVIGKYLIVRSADGHDFALDRASGAEVWSIQQDIPALTVRGEGAAVMVEERVIIASANGKLIALNVADGAYIWETSIAIPRGRLEIDRLTDLNGAPVLSKNTLFISSYKSGVSAVIPIDGEVLWQNKVVSATQGLSADQRYLYLSDANSDVWQLDQRNGDAHWKQTDLHQRRLSMPVVYGDYVVVGDFEGYLHWLSKTDGRLLARIEITDEPIVAQPVVIEETLYVYATDGTLAAVQVLLF